MTSLVKPKTYVLTQRDIQILLDLYTARYMTTVQIQALHWHMTERDHSGQQRACQHRMQVLHAAKLVRKIEPMMRYSEGKRPVIYALAKAGAQVLTEKCGVDPATIEGKPHSREENYPFLTHMLATNDMHIAFKVSAEQTGVQLETWRNELELRSEGMTDVIYLTDPDGRQHKAAVVPDAVAIINRAGKRATLLYEIDMSSVVVDPTVWAKRGWMRKVRTYMTYFESDAFKQRYGAVAQVMTITTGSERLAHLKEATEKAGGNKNFWFTTFQATKQNVLTTPIWERASMDGLHALLR